MMLSEGSSRSEIRSRILSINVGWAAPRIRLILGGIFPEQVEDDACDAEPKRVADDEDRFFDGNGPDKVAGDSGE